MKASQKNEGLPACARRGKAQRMGSAMCAAMKDKLGRQQFEVIIQAAANGKIVARETLKVCAVASDPPPASTGIACGACKLHKPDATAVSPPAC